jgi:hypothetical protein
MVKSRIEDRQLIDFDFWRRTSWGEFFFGRFENVRTERNDSKPVWECSTSIQSREWNKVKSRTQREFQIKSIDKTKGWGLQCPRRSWNHSRVPSFVKSKSSTSTERNYWSHQTIGSILKGRKLITHQRSTIESRSKFSLIQATQKDIVRLTGWDIWTERMQEAVQFR